MIKLQVINGDDFVERANMFLENNKAILKTKIIKELIATFQQELKEYRERAMDYPENFTIRYYGHAKAYLYFLEGIAYGMGILPKTTKLN